MSFLALLVWGQPAGAHDFWQDGSPVPSWVKSACCGPDDVHHMRSDQVHTLPSGWKVDGYPYILPYGRELPSQDGEYWVFYKRYPDESVSAVTCFFVPPKSF